MFTRSITVKGKKYYRIVENYRVNGKVKQAYICSCGPGEIGAENAENFLADDSPYESDLQSVKDDPKVKRLVRSLMPKQKYEDRLKGQNNNVYEGRAKRRKCPANGETITLRVIRESGATICLDYSDCRECKKCKWRS